MWSLVNNPWCKQSWDSMITVMWLCCKLLWIRWHHVTLLQKPHKLPYIFYIFPHCCCIIVNHRQPYGTLFSDLSCNNTGKQYAQLRLCRALRAVFVHNTVQFFKRSHTTRYMFSNCCSEVHTLEKYFAPCLLATTRCYHHALLLTCVYLLWSGINLPPNPTPGTQGALLHFYGNVCDNNDIFWTLLWTLYN